MIYLASSSPRRAELLQQIGVNFEVLTVNIDETISSDERPADYVCRMARSKAEAAIQKNSINQQSDAVIAADTIISIGDKIIGKPADQSECRCILSQLSGRKHRVMSAVALFNRQKLELKLSENLVWFRAIDKTEIVDYCASEEPMDKAGAYGIQGRAAIFIKHLEGSYSSVMGLPLYETDQLMRQDGSRI